jgi:hypothetical protein
MRSAYAKEKKIVTLITNTAKVLATRKIIASARSAKAGWESPRLITTAIVPGPVVRGIVSG